MTKAELIERIMDSLIDPWADCPEDYIGATLIDIHEAQDLIDQIRDDEDKMDLDPKDRLPAEVTPELMMIAYNCNVRKNKHELTVKRLAEYIPDNEMVCEYSTYYLPELENGIDMIPVDFLTDTDGFPFLENASPLDIMRIGVNSRHVFNPNHEFCWFDKEKNILHSTDHPFRDGILDAKAFAEYILSTEGQDCLDYFTECIMDTEDIRKVFEYEKEE